VGVKVYRRRTYSHHSGVCDSDMQARRLYDAVIRHSQCSDVQLHGRAVSFIRFYDVIGNYAADDVTLQVALARNAVVRVDWSAAQRNRAGKDVPRSYEDVRKAVIRSKQHPTEIEGSAAVPARPYIDRLLAEGYDVTTAGYHGRLKARERRLKLESSA